MTSRSINRAFQRLPKLAVEMEKTKLAHKSETTVEIIDGQQAHKLMSDHAFLGHWQTLKDKCMLATAFQSPSFVSEWYASYRAQWQPVVVRSHDSVGDLVGLWLLAYNPITNALVHAGAHQAEYHMWLALPGKDISFLSAAWAELKRRFNFATLRFKYLPSVALGNTLQTVPTMKSSVVVTAQSRPILTLDLENIKASFAKKSNKSRFNRLKKLGTLEFRHIKDSAELEQVFDELIAYYDFRQGAVNHSSPFREDRQKRAFHKALFAATPEETYVAATYLDERLIAAFWGMVSGRMVHLGIVAYSPFLAEHSPGKLHIMQLSENLLKEGKGVLDFTPGGDPWKERFANAHDEVAEAIIYRSVASRIQADTGDGLLQWGKRCAAQAGITPHKLRSCLLILRSMKPSNVIHKIMNWIGMDREFRIYRGDRILAQRYCCDEQVRCNSLSDLLSFEPGQSWQNRDAFLSSALARLEHGESAYTVSIDGRLALSGWIVMNQAQSYIPDVKQSIIFPPGSVALYDFFVHPDFRGHGLYRATIGHILHSVFSVEGTQYVYISMPADNLPSKRTIETMGFEYQGSFFLRRRFGMERKWASPILEQSEVASA